MGLGDISTLPFGPIMEPGGEGQGWSSGEGVGAVAAIQ